MCTYCSYAKSYRTDVLPLLSRVVRMGKRIRYKRYVQHVHGVYVSLHGRVHTTRPCVISIIKINNR